MPNEDFNINGSLIIKRARSRQQLLSADQEQALAKRIERGDMNARDELIESNFRLVLNYANRYRGNGVSYEDLIQEGCIGLMRAAQRYDWQKGFRFSTYAIWWVRQSIVRAIADKSRMIRLPAHMTVKFQSLDRTELQLAYQLGRDPTDDELAEAMSVTPKKIRDWRRLRQATFSLDMPAKNEQPMRDSIPDTMDVFDIAQTTMLRDAIADIVETLLDAREYRIICLRFGLGEEPVPHNREEVGEILGLTRERIRQIEIEALEKLRPYLEKYAPEGTLDVPIEPN